jgi:hypothetical protein
MIHRASRIARLARTRREIGGTELLGDALVGVGVALLQKSTYD